MNYGLLGCYMLTKAVLIGCKKIMKAVLLGRYMIMKSVLLGCYMIMKSVLHGWYIWNLTDVFDAATPLFMYVTHFLQHCITNKKAYKVWR